ncbi:kinase-like protein [Bimuria novae-zelandiae CBS 107.79]|uniref:Kinase-like protein n=1 Tax=Bimuria novae-zelandiae CBS 107.79 TaxID=1447943 RepID=A0A6A5UUI3_9PLEO|nr:kinase-like protein [Bimuria novae-zelandiae CBS 107.79]
MSMFRRPGDSSSSEDEASSIREETSIGAEADPVSRIHTLDSSTSAPLSLQPGGATASNRPGISRSNTGSNVRDLLLHSLLEEKALNQAAEHLGRSKTDADVIALAQQTYEGLAQQFATQLDVSYARDEMRGQRDAAKEGINRATRLQMAGITAAATAIGTSAAAGVSGALVARPSFVGIPVENPSAFSRDMEALNEYYHLLPSSVQGYTAMHNDRYAREYEEIGIVGKGGYGKVYKVKHKLDNAFYAIKKVTISPSKLQKIRERGDQELHSILEEVRSLARFDHSNIVRYYAAWMEFSTERADVADLPTTAPVTRPDRLLEHPSDPTFSESAAEPLYDSFGSMGIDDPFERGALESAGITFEDSDTGVGAEDAAERGPIEMKKRGRTRRTSQATIATISSTKSRLSAVQDADEDEIETVHRDQEPTLEETESMVTDSEAPNQLIPAHTAGPILTLNIQMSFCENDLATFLAEHQRAPNHCFHPCISLELLDRIIGGVEYLHESEVVHRDLKPANIFLSFSTNRVPPPGSVDLSSCASCPKRDCLHVTPRIGDFGLVAKLSAIAAHPVGTELYRPKSVGKVDEKLDVFALGVVGFELLERFGTKSERADVLAKLRSGHIEEEFAKGCGDMRDMVKRMVSGMVAQDSEARWTCEEVRREIAKIVSGLRV